MQLEYNRAFEGHTGPVYALAHSHSAHCFYSAGSDGLIAKWNLQKENAIGVAKLPHKVFCMQLLTNSLLVAGTSSGGIYLLDLTKTSGPRNIQFDTSICYNICKINAKLFATTHESGKVVFWTPESGSVVKSIQLTDKKVRGIASNESHVYIGCGDGSISVIEIETLDVAHSFQAHQIGFGVNCLMIDATSNQLISGGKDGHLNFWDLKTLASLAKIPAHNYALYDLQLKGTSLFTSSRDKSIKAWDIETRQFSCKRIREKTEGHLHSVNRILLLDNQYLISAGDDKKVIAWKLSL